MRYNVIQAVLGHLLPGQNVLLRFKTRDARELAGYWVWDLVELVHVHAPWNDIPMKAQCSQRERMRNTCRRAWRYKDAKRLYDKLRVVA